MTVIPFRSKPTVVITRIFVINETTVSATGKMRVKYDPPRTAYLLDLLDAEGKTCLGDCTSHAEALVAANEWAADGVVVRDLTLEHRGRE